MKLRFIERVYTRKLHSCIYTKVLQQYGEIEQLPNSTDGEGNPIYDGPTIEGWYDVPLVTEPESEVAPYRMQTDNPSAPDYDWQADREWFNQRLANASIHNSELESRLAAAGQRIASLERVCAEWAKRYEAVIAFLPVKS